MMWKLAILLCVVCSANLVAEVNMLALAGSTRAESLNKKLAAEAVYLARQMGATVTFIDLKDYAMPFYDGDLETNKGMPAKAKKFRQLIQKNQVILIASPEYNGSLSAVLKNTIDWASRTEEGGAARKVFQGKKFVVMSASNGSSGGAKGLGHLRTIIEHLGGIVMPKEVSVPKAATAFDEQGHLKNPQLKTELQQLIQMALQ